ncbi:hypothetical protein [Arenibacter troitsensis]|uniref:Uncharacterized protein n=1 Tax=Arenibacter troitsensis TaxID=188872 RepID=A0A1X7IQ26_9FLAO|nr:hypothetical protein [Arenibacter troitsensis]SMG17033.1 hypothetical protein SAMN03080602_00934 [Arenibacter troitsensis]
MKKYFLILALVISSATYSQDLPTEPANGFAFPLGTKFTIKMHPTDSTNFDYSVIKLEPFQEIVDIYENDSLFKDPDEKNGTIEFYFCLGTSVETDEEKEKNMKVLLLMKNLTENSFGYNSDIQTEENGEFKTTSNVGTYSGAKGTEIWPYMIHQIALNEFKIAK